MIRLKVSYENEKELKNFLLFIKSITKGIKLANNDKGRFKKAYVDLKNIDIRVLKD